ncbi:MAG: LysR family transcriptional regulator [Oscillospiraceae bacterium]|nr:LysR family transcriptional regulator [Oscillospiraceae bacterium]
MKKMTYNFTCRLFTDTKCFGPGIAQLLHTVDRLHSLRAAAAEMEMAYSKAWNIIRNSEDSLGFKLLLSSVGGKGGGGACLTEEAVKLLESYDAFCSSLRTYGDSLFDKQFGWLEK